MLSCHGLVKSFDEGTGTLEVLKGVDMEVMPGERVAIIGASGADDGDSVPWLNCWSAYCRYVSLRQTFILSASCQHACDGPTSVKSVPSLFCWLWCRPSIQLGAVP